MYMTKVETLIEKATDLLLRQGALLQSVLLEMGEEAGSPGLREFCEQHRSLLAADLLIACDGPRVHAQRPTVFLGSRGLDRKSTRLNSSH